jgi:hypothetical protein
MLPADMNYLIIDSGAQSKLLPACCICMLRFTRGICLTADPLVLRERPWIEHAAPIDHEGALVQFIQQTG